MTQSQPAAMYQRQQMALGTCKVLHFSFPTVVDEPDNRAAITYSVSTTTVFVVRKDGAIGYRGDMNRFDADEMSRCLESLVGPADSRA